MKHWHTKDVSRTGAGAIRSTEVEVDTDVCDKNVCYNDVT